MPTRRRSDADPPSDADLAAALGPSRRAWDRIRETLAAEHGVTESEWRRYTKKSGPSLRLLRRGRAIVYLTPGDGRFGASLILGDAAVAAARAAGLPQTVLALLDAAHRYAEGTGVRMEVRTLAHADAVLRLAEIKLAH